MDSKAIGERRVVGFEGPVGQAVEPIIRRAQDGTCGIHKSENAESTDSETNQDTHKADVQEAYAEGKANFGKAKTEAKNTF